MLETGKLEVRFGCWSCWIAPPSEFRLNAYHIQLQTSTACPIRDNRDVNTTEGTRAASEASENARSAPGAAPTGPATPAPAKKARQTFGSPWGASGASQSLTDFLSRCRSHRAGGCSSGRRLCIFRSLRGSAFSQKIHHKCTARHLHLAPSTRIVVFAQHPAYHLTQTARPIPHGVQGLLVKHAAWDDSSAPSGLVTTA